MKYQIAERLLQCEECLPFLKHHHKLPDQKKDFDYFFFLFFMIMILGWFLNLLTAFITWSSVPMISRYFQVWNNTYKKFVKNFCYILIFCMYFFWNYFLLTFLGDNFFSISVILNFVFILSVKNGFTVFKKSFAIGDAIRINITTEVLPFTPNLT